jgi:aminoglycoside phosphotransferase (APT) family kinase protein
MTGTDRLSASVPGSAETAASDVVASQAEADLAELAPLIVLEGLETLVPGSGPLRVEKLGTGHSNETFRVSRDDAEFVLRRPPRPPLAPTAHDVIREARILGALADLDLRVPRPVLIHDDPDAIGAPFYLMELVPGVVIRDSMPAALDQPSGRRGVVSEFVEALVEVHAADWRGTPLEGVGRPSGYLERQLRRWNGQWDHNGTRDVPEIEQIGRWLATNRPQGTETTFVHGDAKLDNAIYEPQLPVRLAVLVDWEMATLGDPLADLGLLCGTYVGPGEEPDPVFGFSAATNREGAPQREEIAEWYAERSGRSIEHLLWYEVLAVWKIMILLEGSYKRYLAGTTQDPFFSLLKAGIPRMAGLTLDRTKPGRPSGRN